jgi:endo-1,4-beta-xylanase
MRALASSLLIGLLHSVPVAAAGGWIVYPQAAVGPLGGQEFEIELRLGNRDPNEPLQITARFLQQITLQGMSGLRVSRGGGEIELPDGVLELELPPSGAELLKVTSPETLQVGPAVLEISTGDPTDVVPSFFYRLRGSQAVQDLIAIQPVREPALTYSSVISQLTGFSVGLALVSESCLAAAVERLPLPATYVTIAVRLPDGREFSTQVTLGGSEPGQQALFPNQLLSGLPAEFEAAQLEIAASSPVYATLLAVGAPPVFEDVQIGANPPQVEAGTRFPLPSGWMFPPGLDNLVAGAYWECAGGGLREVPGGVIGQAGGNWQTTIHELGPSLVVDGPLAVSTALEAAPGYTGSLVLAGRPPTGPEWWRGLVRLDVGVSGGGIQITGWNDSPAPVLGSRLEPEGALQGRVKLRLERRGSEWVVFADGQEAGRFADFGLIPQNRLWFGTNIGPRQRLTLYGLAVETPASQPEAARLVPPAAGEKVPARTPSLRAAAAARGLGIGAAAVPELLSREEIYRRTLGGEFNMLVAENVMKWGLIHPERDRFNFCPGDVLVGFAETNEMGVRGHTLVWHEQNPGWVTEGEFSRDEAIEILREHVLTVVRHYRGRVAQWDVLNEAVEWDGTLRRTLWLERIGPEYIDMVFRWAREADPDALLFYNDFGIEEVGRKSDAVLNLLRSLRERGVPVDGVGFQCHLDQNSLSPVFRTRFKTNLQRFTDLGLRIALTEVDVRLKLPVSANALTAQAQTYRDLMEVCLELPACKTFMTWGFTDRYSWIPGFTPGYGAALPFDEQYQPKPAYYALLSALTGVD